MGWIGDMGDRVREAQSRLGQLVGGQLGWALVSGYLINTNLGVAVQGFCRCGQCLQSAACK